jgi:phosphatidylethanolamine/phosphatidyl-N-methylethanolamine N-methyltransferase
MHTDTVKTAYRRYAGVYDALFGPVLQAGRKAVLQALQLRPGDRVLEVGVGTGLSLTMYPPSVRVTGIDLSSEMLEKARGRVARHDLANVEALLEMDAETMSFADASFDKVVAMYVMPVVRNPARVLEEFHRVCRPDGEIYLVNHVKSDNRIIRAFEMGLARFSNQIGFRPDFELRELVNGSGQIDEVARINVLWRVMRVRNGIAHRRYASQDVTLRPDHSGG